MAVERVPRIRFGLSRTLPPSSSVATSSTRRCSPRTPRGSTNGCPDWGRFGISAFEADSDAEIDVVCQTRLVRFPTVVVFERSMLERAGVDVVPTFRRPHVTLCHESIDQLVERLVHCEHRVLINPYHVTESEE